MPAAQRALACALILGVASTLGDLVWALWIPDGSLPGAIAHGALALGLVGLVLARAARVSAPVMVGGLALAGVAIAAAFYPVARGIDALIPGRGYFAGLLVSWLAMWAAVALALRIAGRREPAWKALVRAALAAVGSGLAFASVAWMWTTSPGPGYPLRLLLWTWAFAPGFLALLTAHSEPELDAELEGLAETEGVEPSRA